MVGIQIPLSHLLNFLDKLMLEERTCERQIFLLLVAENVCSLLPSALPPPRKTRAELMKAIDAEYYGYRDEDDGVLEPLEQEHERKGKALKSSLK